MAELSELDPTGRFTGLADLYAQNRPDYPGVALEYIRTNCGLHPGSVLVDVGSGTGISSRQLAGLGIQVIGLEPNDEMRARASAFSPSPLGGKGRGEGIDKPLVERPPHPNLPPQGERGPEPDPDPSPSRGEERMALAPVYRAGRAEATGLPDGCADVVLAAQAFHWFEPEPTLQEFHRILKPGGWAVLLWNERDESDPFTAAYGAVVRSTPESAALEQSRRRSGAPLLASPLFHQGRRVSFPNHQVHDEDGLLGRALSVSYAPRQPEQVARFCAGVREVFARFQQDGRVVLRYQTTVVVAQRRCI